MEVGLQNLALGFALGQEMVKTTSHRDQALPFPLVYAIFMYGWGVALIPILRCQRRKNIDNGVEDLDADFFIEDVSDVEMARDGRTYPLEEMAGDANGSGRQEKV